MPKTTITTTRRTRRNRRPRRPRIIVQAPPPPVRRPRRRRARKQPGILSRVMTYAAKGIPAVIKAVTGFGDYHVASNSLLTGGLNPPEIVNSVNSGAFIVRHREYIADVTSTENFTMREFAIQPGLPATFPWLAQVAHAYEQYRIRGMIFEFKSTSSNAVLSTAASTALGTVIMATSYNPSLVEFVDKRTMENYQFANSCAPSANLMHPIECARNQTPVTELFIRTDDVPQGDDIKLYDIGKFVLATVGMQQTGGIIGELWVTFEIEFLKPKMLEEIGVLQAATIYTPSYTNALPLLGGTLQPGSNLDMLISGGVLYFPADLNFGSYLLIFYWVGTSAAITFPGFTFTNCAAKAFWGTGAAPSAPAPLPATTASTTAMHALIVDVSGVNASVGLDGAGLLPTGTRSLTCLVTRTNENLTFKGNQHGNLINLLNMSDLESDTDSTDDELHEQLLELLKKMKST